MESLSDKLKSLGVQQGVNHLPLSKQTGKSFPIETVLPGINDLTTYGNTFIFERHTNSNDLQGQVPFKSRPDFTVLSAWRKSPELKDVPIDRILYLDTETSGLAGGTGTFAFMIGVGFIDELGFHLYQLFLRHPAEEQALLASLTRLIEKFQVVVTFNGASFDIPLLNARHVLQTIQSPFTSRIHVDLLPLARRLWKNRLPSRRLGNLEIEILGLARTEEEVPGWLVPEIYHEYILSGDARPLAGVFYHNEMDIRSLAALFIYCADLLDKPMAYAADEGLDLIAIGKLFDDLGQSDRALALYEAGINAGLPHDFYLQTLMRYSNIYRKNGNYPKAQSLWEKAAGLGSIEACIHLSKFYEHSLKEFHQAMYWTEKAVNLILVNTSGEHHLQEYQLAPLRSRLARLKTKLGKFNG